MSGYVVKTTFVLASLPEGAKIDQVPTALLRYSHEPFEDRLKAIAYAWNQRALSIPNVTVLSVKLIRVRHKD